MNLKCAICFFFKKQCYSAIGWKKWICTVTGSYFATNVVQCTPPNADFLFPDGRFVSCTGRARRMSLCTSAFGGACLVFVLCMCCVACSARLLSCPSCVPCSFGSLFLYALMLLCSCRSRTSPMGLPCTKKMVTHLLRRSLSLSTHLWWNRTLPPYLNSGPARSGQLKTTKIVFFRTTSQNTNLKTKSSGTHPPSYAEALFGPLVSPQKQ